MPVTIGPDSQHLPAPRHSDCAVMSANPDGPFGLSGDCEMPHKWGRTATYCVGKNITESQRWM